MSGNQQSATRDITYNLISVMYHALQGADTCDVYIRDAEKDGDQDLVKYFQDVKQQYQNTAEQGKKLLAKRLG